MPIPSTPENSDFHASVIISVYKDHVALRLILQALLSQSMDAFEIIISEDGESQEIASVRTEFEKEFGARLEHLFQKDLGFRKNRALNRAIIQARSNYLIFIDGDCIPHSEFVKSHYDSRETHTVCCGKRVDLDPTNSEAIRQKRLLVSQLEKPLFYLSKAHNLIRKGTRHYESGIHSNLLQFITKSRKINIVGCNFSCHKTDLEMINGFDERYESAGTGEDSDIQWRMEGIGIKMKNIRFIAQLFHLHHKRSGLSHANESIFESVKRENTLVCKNGIKKL
jgi:glycosyltransferase involved in cell wall biosynthesis